MAEINTLRIAAVFAADANFQVRAGRAAGLDSHSHERPNAGLIKGGKGIFRQDLLVNVLQQEALLSIITRDAEGHLRQVVGAEGEELRHLGDLAGGQGRARDLDHRAELIVDINALFRHDLLGLVQEGRLLNLQLVDMRGQRDHDLGLDHHTILGAVAGRFEDRAHLHAGQAGEVNAQADAAQAQHGIGFVHGLHGRQHRFLGGQLRRAGLGEAQFGHLDQQIFL